MLGCFAVESAALTAELEQIVTSMSGIAATETRVRIKQHLLRGHFGGGDSQYSRCAHRYRFTYQRSFNATPAASSLPASLHWLAAGIALNKCIEHTVGGAQCRKPFPIARSTGAKVIQIAKMRCRTTHCRKSLKTAFQKSSRESSPPDARGTQRQYSG